MIDQLFVSWGPQETSGIVPVQTQRPENQEHQCPKAGEDGYASSSRERKFVFSPSFCLIWPSTDGMMATHIRESNPFYMVY